MLSKEAIHHLMLCLHPFLSVSAPSLSKCRVSHEAVHKSLLRLICREEAASMRQKANLNSSCMGSFDLALGETDSDAGRKEKQMA